MLSGSLHFFKKIVSLCKVLKRKFGLVDSPSTTVILSGTSAGGEALYSNADKVSQDLMKKSKVMAIDDSGYFQYSVPLRAHNCTDAGSCTEAQGMIQGATYWNAQMNPSCLRAFPNHPWYCLMGPTVLPHLITKTFVFNYLFDAAQFGHDGLGKPSTPTEETYALQSARNLTSLLSMHPYFFLPACYYHGILQTPQWNSIAVQGVFLTDAIARFLSGNKVQLADSTAKVEYNPTCPQ